MGRIKSRTPRDIRDIVRVVLKEFPELPTERWARMILVMQEGEILVAGWFVGIDSQEQLDALGEENIYWLVHEDHVYFPLRWVAERRPERAELWSWLEKAARGILTHEISKRGL
jgi:hypothetical protein